VTFTGICDIHRNLWRTYSKEMCNTFLDTCLWNTPTNSQRCATHCIHRNVNVWHTPASHMCEITLTHSCGYECVSVRVSVYSYLSPYRYTLQSTLQHTHQLPLYMQVFDPPPYQWGGIKGSVCVWVYVCVYRIQGCVSIPKGSRSVRVYNQGACVFVRTPLWNLYARIWVMIIISVGVWITECDEGMRLTHIIHSMRAYTKRWGNMSHTHQAMIFRIVWMCVSLCVSLYLNRIAFMCVRHVPSSHCYVNMGR